jgi:hypothetical protein
MKGPDTFGGLSKPQLDAIVQKHGLAIAQDLAAAGGDMLGLVGVSQAFLLFALITTTKPKDWHAAVDEHARQVHAMIRARRPDV